MTKSVLFSLLSLAIVFSTVCLGQFETATVLGTVHDPSGAAMVGGKVTLENVKTGVSIVSKANDAGNFEFINVSIGTYRVKAESSGFKTSVTDDFTVTVSARQRVDLTLSVGDITQTISVKDAAAVLETESSDRGQVINNLTIVNLPLNGRSYADLALLAPGVRKSFLGMDQSSSN